MKLKFKQQQYQDDAVMSIVECFKGQEKGSRKDIIARYTKTLDKGTLIEETEDIEIVSFGNYKITLTEAERRENIRNVQKSNDITYTDNQSLNDFSVEMETGTGKTYTYIKTMYELNKEYGWSKFIVMVPSIAIREGVQKSFEITQEHFQEIYHKKMDCIYTVYDGISINFSDTIKLSPIPVNISVIIPVYNMGAYIREALDSVISQTLKNIEIICINDGSTDNSIDILNEYSQRDPRIKVINKENEGVASARNDAIRVANGEYLFFLDPDDWLPDSDVLHDLYEAAKKHNVLVCGGNFVEYASGYINDRWSGANSKYTFDREGFIDYYNYQFDYGWVRFLYKRQFLIDNNLWIPKLTFFEDPQFFVRVMTCAKNFYVLPRPTYCYRSGHHSYELSYTKVIDLIHSMTAIIKIAKENEYKNLIALEKYRLSHDYSWEVIKYLKGIRNEELKSALRNLNLVLFDGKDSIEYEMYDVIIARKDYEIWIQSSINADIKGRIKQKVKKILKRVLPKQVINMLKRMR